MKTLKKEELSIINGGVGLAFPPVSRVGIVKGLIPVPPVRIKEPYYPIVPVNPRYSKR
ncbi:hypothetical protein ABW636_08240 [Aquimarina sp. 2201CG1-2-11]|uniref:hypothetical protein n=1 Tax=Aquimarina discodermiae TaxID=3231043 RepID=UPI0034635A96